MDELSELDLLREFYSCWVFFHATRNDPTESEAWNRTRQEVTAQQLVDAANAVERCQKKVAH